MYQQRTPRMRRGLRAIAVTVLLSVGAGSAGVATAAGSQAVDARDAATVAGQPAVAAKPATVTGTAVDGRAFTGTFTLTKFQARKGVLYAVGQLQGTLGGEPVSRSVSWPISGASSNPATTTATGFMQTSDACTILTLELGPLDLNLLGLRVFLDEVNLLIEAIPGAGNLLGNLLCGIAGLLDGIGGVGGLGDLIDDLLTAIANLLNGILG
jgi:hypothetical protein